MGSKKNKLWKTILIIFCITGPPLVWLGFGERGLIRLYRTELERRACVDRIQNISEENDTLLEEVYRLRTDMKYIEYVARRELKLIKKNEVMYRFSKDKKTDATQKESWPYNTDRKSKKGGIGNGKTK